VGTHVATRRRPASAGIRLDPSGPRQPHPAPAVVVAAGEAVLREVLRRAGGAVNAELKRYPHVRFRGSFLRVFRSVFFISITCLLFACADHQIARPTTEGGRLCAAACDESRALCDRMAETEASLEASGCDSGKQSAEQACSPPADNVVDRCMAAQFPQICTGPAPKYGPCKSDWERCVLSCGGRMIYSRTR